MPELAKRIIFGFLAFFAILLIMWAGLPLMAPLYILACIASIEEYSLLMRSKGIPIRKRSLWVAALLTLPASLPVTYPGMQPFFDGVSWREVLIGVFAFYLITLEVVKPNNNSMFAAIFSFFGYLYIPWLLGYMITLRYTPDGVIGLWYLMLAMLGIIASDVGAFMFGRLFGKTKLAPNISPNKTLEGSLGGLAFAVLVVSIASFALEAWMGLNVDIYNSIIFGLLVASSAQLGDLFESLIKRWAGIKDTGGFLPGHGGVLDRLDSILFTVPITYYFVILVVLR